MKRMLAVVGWVLVSACGAPEGGQDAGRDDAGHDAGVRDAVLTCSCSERNTCCDGCKPINEGSTCDDGLQCSATSTCQQGLCALKTPTCTVSVLDCQIRSCDEIAGCGVIRPAREGFTCSDGDPSTIREHCINGACVGTQTCANGRFEVLDGGTVLDTTTNLFWQRQQSPFKRTWSEANTYCSGGWRLPNSAELDGIYVSGAPFPRIDSCAFPNTSAEFFWSVDMSDQGPGYYEVINFGGCCGPAGDDPSAPHWVRCVR